MDGLYVHLAVIGAHKIQFCQKVIGELLFWFK